VSEEEKKSPTMTDLARKILLTGVGAIFMTEETVRKGLSELKLPTDAVSTLVDTVKKQKNEVLEIVAVELGNFFSKVKVHEELQKALKGMQIHLDAMISFDKPGEVHKAKVTVKRQNLEE
jgi:hypothetical protein